jgi:hypothetical protein
MIFSMNLLPSNHSMDNYPRVYSIHVPRLFRPITVLPLGFDGISGWQRRPSSVRLREERIPKTNIRRKRQPLTIRLKIRLSFERIADLILRAW